MVEEHVLIQFLKTGGEKLKPSLKIGYTISVRKTIKKGIDDQSNPEKNAGGFTI